MKEWISKYKLYLAAGALLVLGCLYYFFINQPAATNQQTITGIEKNSSPTLGGNSTSSGEKDKNQSEQTKTADKAEAWIVDVKGEIKQPGVYPAGQNERVMDVIQKAGGLTDNADSSQVNFAAHVEDAMVIYIPAKGETPVNAPAANPAPAAAKSTPGSSGGKININKADENELQNLPGIGPAKATAIVQYRQDNGPFQTIDDLKKISGIGDKTFEKLKESISVQ